jgi:hypothetical protein
LGSTADAGALVGQRLLGDADLGALRDAVGDDQRGHDLGDAGDRQDPRRVLAPQHAAGVEVEEQPGARLVAEADLDGVGRAVERQRQR